jgi:hypothetical protein
VINIASTWTSPSRRPARWSRNWSPRATWNAAHTPATLAARLVVLAGKGWACARAAEEAAEESLRPWADAIGPRRLAALRADLAGLADPGRLRPIW